MPQESISTRPVAPPPALSGDSVRLPQPLFWLLFWSTWLRERLLILLPALTVLYLGLCVAGPPFAEINEETLWCEHFPGLTRLAIGFGLWLGHGWPLPLLLVVLVLFLPTALRRQLRARFPAEALPDFALLRVWDRPAYALTSVVFVMVAGLFLVYAFLGGL